MRILFLLIVSLISLQLGSQNNDCINAVPVCSDDDIEFNPSGFGVQELLASNTGCLESFETNSAWYFFRMSDQTPPGSILEFEIEPLCASTDEDYDFAIFGPDVECINLGSPIRCSYAAPTFVDCSLTGLRASANDFSEDSGGDGYVRPLIVNPGETYFLMVDNFQGSGTGFTLEWSGSAAPFLDCSIICELTFTTDDQMVCQGSDPLQLDLEITSTVDEFTYRWEGSAEALSFLSGLTLRNPVVTFPSDFSGEILYDVTVTSLDSTCFETRTIRIDVIPPIEFISNDTTVCQGAQFALPVSLPNMEPNLNIGWGIDNGQTDWLNFNAFPPILTLPPDFNGQIMLTGTILDEPGMCTPREEFTITVDEGPVVPSIPDVEIPCESGTVDFDPGLQLDPSIDVRWIFNGDTISNTQMVTANVPGTYILDFNDGSCASQGPVQFVNDEGIQDVIFDIGGLICSPGDVGFISNINVIDGTEPYRLFLDGDEIPFTSTIENIGQGDHTIEVVDGNNCRFLVPFTIETVAETTIDIGEDMLVELGSPVSASATTNLSPDQTASLNWFFNGTRLCENCNPVEFAPNGDGFLVAEITNLNGCVFADSLLITVFELGQEVFVPNVFSPNGDFINDHLIVYGGEGVQEVEEMHIYDRWGNQVYFVKNLPLGETTDAWDGRFKNRKMNPGVYIYYVKVRLTNQNFKEVKGDFTLIR
ncbi:MAG: gliding motility-associated C-terminal domain-containing protein [Bacteroidota bacterium]